MKVLDLFCGGGGASIDIKRVRHNYTQYIFSFLK